VSARTVETRGPKETESLGGELARALAAGDLVLIRGELGSGKTTLVRGAARALGVSGPVTSPTFSIGHRYAGAAVTVSTLTCTGSPTSIRRSPTCSPTTWARAGSRSWSGRPRPRASWPARACG